jgi:hypothetical protein
MKDEHTNGKKMARNGRNTVISKGTFISNHSLRVTTTTTTTTVTMTGKNKVQSRFFRANTKHVHTYNNEIHILVECS